MTDHRTTPQKSTWRAKLAVGAAALTVIVVVGVLGGRWWLEQHIGEELKRRAHARGWELTWDELSLGVDRRLEITDLRGAGPHSETLTLTRVGAWFDWRKVLQGQRRPQRVEFQGLKAHLNAQHLRSGSRAEDDAAVAPAGSKPQGSTAALFNALSQVTLRWSEVEVTLEGLPAPLPEALSITGLEASNSPTEAGWEITGQGTCATGCGEASGATLRVAGDLRGRVELVGELRGSPMTLKVPRTGDAGDVAVSFRGITVVRQPAGAVRVALRAVETRGAAQGWDAEVETDAVEFELDAAHRPMWPVTLKRPQVTLKRQAQRREGLEPGEAQDIAEGTKSVPAPDALLKLSGKEWLGRLLRWRPDQTQALAARLLDVLGRVRVEEGRVSWGAYTLEGVTVEPAGDTLTIGVKHHGEWSATLRRGDPEVSVGLKGVSLAAWKGVLERRGWWPRQVSLSGQVSGTLAWRPGVEMPAPQMKVRPSPRRAVTGEAGQRVRAELTVSQGSLSVSALSGTPVEAAEARVRLELLGAPAQKRRADWWVVREASLTLPSRVGGAATLHAEAELRHMLDGRDPVMASRVWVEEGPCAQAVGALPVGMLPSLHSVLEVEGRFGPSLTVAVNMADPEQVSLSIKGLPGSCRVTALGPHDPSWLNTDFVRPVREGVSEGKRVEVGPGTAEYVKLKATPAWVGAAAYLSEEAAFYRNKGFAPGLIRRAIGMNLKGRRYVYGGSSVSQQLVKNLFLTRSKTLSRKLEEAFIVWRMEEVVSKDRILELYLNCIEFGPDLYGIGRAAQVYFGKPATRLSPLEASFLAAIKPAPWLGARFAAWGHSPSKGWWRERLAYLMERLHEKGFISQETLSAAEPYVVKLRRRAPHKAR